MKRTYLTLAAAVFSALSLTMTPGTAVVAPGEPQLEIGCRGSGSGSRVTESGPYAALPGELTALVSDYDGEKIEVAVVRPDVDAGVRVPVITFASPYLAGGFDGEWTRCRPRLTDNFIQHGYAVAFVPVRGTADSGSCFDLMGDAERADLDQAITWLGTRSWSNGAVGMIGVSYDGSTPWEVASMGNPHLKTIVPISGVNDVFHLMYKTTGNEGRGRGTLNALYYSYGFAEYNVATGRSAPRMVTGVACEESIKGLAAAQYAAATGTRDPLGWFAERNLRPGVEANYGGSILLVHGLQDTNVDAGHAYPWVNELEAAGIPVHHFLGQWGHAWPDTDSRWTHNRFDWADQLLDWFDRWLKGDTSIAFPKAQVQDTTLRWRVEDTWPPSGTTELVLTPAPDGSLTTEPAPSGSVLTVGGRGTCSTCAAFSTDVLEEDLRFVGRPRLHLRVTPTAPGGSIVVELLRPGRQAFYAVEQDVITAETRIGWGVGDLRFPDGGETPTEVTPGVPVDMIIALQPLDAVVPQDGRLILRIHQGDTADHEGSMMAAPLRIELGDGATFLSLDTHRPDPGSFFSIFD